MNQLSKIFIEIPFKVCKRIIRKVQYLYDDVYLHIYLRGNGIDYKSFKAFGRPYISKALKGRCTIGKNFTIISSLGAAPTGNILKSVLIVNPDATLTIGNNVGISSTCLICHHSITIEDNVKIGAGTKVVDTDFHSLDPVKRAGKEDFNNKALAPVLIKSNSFIGAYSFILKGVTIGENSIVGAGSVVTKSIPANEIWAGNPARKIRSIDKTINNGKETD